MTPRIDPPPIDLGPLLATDQDAAAMLLLARGQLNRAFRAHGLPAPDALAAGARRGIDAAALDDPAAHRATWATPKLAAAFAAWTRALPPALVPPVLEILRRTHAALRAQGNGTGNAAACVLKAHDFLRAQLPRADDCPADDFSAHEVAAAA